jgi:hypothetical protein
VWQTERLQVGRSTFDEVRKTVLEVFCLNEEEGEIIGETDDAWEYQYVRAKLLKVAAIHDFRLPGYRRETTVVGDELDWERAIAGYPWSRETWLQHTVGYLTEKLLYSPTAVEPISQPLVESAEVEAGLGAGAELSESEQLLVAQLRFEGLCGVWELAAEKATHHQIRVATLEGVLAALNLRDDEDEKAHTAAATKPQRGFLMSAVELQVCGGWKRVTLSTSPRLH